MERYRIFMGYNYTSEKKYRLFNGLDFVIEDYSLNELNSVLGTVINMRIGKDKKLIIDEELSFGVKSNVKSECINTYTIVGHTAGYYILSDFEGDVLVALTHKEVRRNRKKFNGRFFTNAMVYMCPVDMYEDYLRVDCVRHSLLDILTLGSVSINRKFSKRVMSSMLNLLEIREETMASNEWETPKVNHHNFEVLKINSKEIWRVLENGGDCRRLLEKMGKRMRKDKGLLDSIYLNTVLNEED